jgi:hypothetical protein
MKNVLLTICCSAVIFNGAQAQFTPGRLAVLQVGDGSAALSSAGTPLFLKEFTTTGTAGFSVTIPTTGASALVSSGSATSEGLITRSSDSSMIVIAGYNTASGTTGVASTTSTAVHRAAGTIDKNGNYSLAATASTTFYSGNNVRSATSDGAGNFWLSGVNASGTSAAVYVNGATSTAMSTTVPANGRTIGIQNGQLYVVTGSGTAGVYTIGSGMPTTSGQTQTLVFALNSTNTSPYYFAFSPDGNTCYVSDDGGASNGGIYKYQMTAGTWNSGTRIFNTAVRGLIADFSTANPTLYATTTASSANTLISITDNYSGTALTSTLLATASANTVFRGVAFTPNSPNAPLAIQLKDFSAKSIGKSNEIDWNTAQEDNNNYFELSESNDGKSFATMATINAKGNNSNYQYIDQNPTGAISYYRLAMVDVSGKKTYSNIVSVSNQVRNTVQMNVFPNPVLNNVLYISFSAASKNNYTVSVLNNLGQVVLKQTIQGNTAQAKTAINIPSSLTKGIYHLNVTDGISNFSQEIVVGK